MREPKAVVNDALDRAGRLIDAGGRGRIAWAATAIGAAILLLVCTSMQSRARDAERTLVQKRAVRAVHTQIVPELSARDVSRPIGGRVLRELGARVDAEILDAPGTAGVRIWSRDGTPLFAMPTQDLGAPGDETLTRIEDAVAGTTTSVETAETIPSGAEGGEPSELLVLRTFTPLQLPGSRTLAAAEVLTFSSAIDDASAQPWQTLRIALGVLLLAAVLLLLLAVRWATDELHDPPVSPAAAALPGVEDLRSERDRLNAMLAQEVARREAAESAVEALREEVREAHASRAWLQARIDNADASRTVPQRADRD